MLDWYKRVFNGFYKHVLTIAITIGVTLLVLCYSDLVFPAAHWMRDVCKVAGTSVLSGGVFMAIAKGYQFSTIYREELKKVIYSKDFLKKRTDINEIWEEVSDALCDNRFNTISNDVFRAIKDNYLPYEEEYYSDRIHIDTTIEFDEEDDSYLIVSDKSRQEVVTADPDGFWYRYDSSIPIPKEEDGEKTVYSLEQLQINNKDYNIQDLIDNKYLTIVRFPHLLEVKFAMPIEGSKTWKRSEYTIIRKEKTVYNIKTNPYISQRAFWLYKFFTVKFTFPLNFELDWVDSGTLESWKLERDHHNQMQSLTGTYDGLIFKNQGFIVYFKKE